MNSDCLVFDTSIAQVMLYDPCASIEMLSFQLFADNGNLGINVTISMCWVPLGLQPLRDCDAGHGEQCDIGLVVTKLGVRSVVNRPQEENYQGISFPPLGWVSYHVSVHSLAAHFRRTSLICNYSYLPLFAILPNVSYLQTPHPHPPPDISNMILKFMARNKVSLNGTVIGRRFDFLVS